ncbi:MAG: PAS domain S-box protein [Frankiaceae bacterium]|nr:PAS domain S-box protein [Frankiaceae bacterium]MBV9872790.1 PAS domain S-box protein [Frankiaceae bacterium]
MTVRPIVTSDSPTGDAATDALLVAAVESATDAVITVDLEGIITSWNRGAETLYGYDVAEAVGQRLSALIFFKGSQAEWQDRLDLVQVGGSVSHDIVRRRRKDGAEIVVSVTVSPLRLRDGVAVGAVAICRDFTQELATAGALEQVGFERDLLSQSIDSAPVYVMAFDQHGIVMIARGRGAPTQQRSASDLVGGSMFDLYAEEPAILGAVEAALAGEELDIFVDYQGRRIQAAYRPLRLADGTVAGGTVSSVDVTDLMLATEALARAEARSRALLEHVSEIIVITDQDGFIVDAEVGSPGAFGYTPEDLTSHLGWDFLHPDDVPRVRVVWDELLERPGAQRQVTLRLRHADGSWGWAEETIANALDDPAIRGMVINCRDVTDTRRAQEALVESERRYRRVVDASSDAIAVLDDRRRILLANPRLAELVGRRRDELIGAAFTELGLPDPHNHPVGGLAPVRVQLQGRMLWLRVLALALATADGASERTMIVITDDTERIAMQQQMVDTERLQAVGRFAGGVAHDFNNVLTAIRGHAELLLEGLPPTVPNVADAQAIMRGAERASAFVQQLLAFARGQRLEPAVVDVNDVIDATLEVCSDLIPAGIKLRVEVDPSAVVYADAVQLERVIANLVLNARDAIGGVGTIDLSVSAHDGQVVIVVADDGRGMTAEEASRCFEPFFTTKDSGNGTGLGLASVYGVVTQSGGSIEVETELGAGSRFVISLPQCDGQGVPVLATGNSADDELGSAPVVLVVDDDAAVRGLAVRILESAGYRAVGATGAADAIARSEALERPVDLLLTDVRMPGEDGVSLARRMRERGLTKRVLLMSGYAMTGTGLAVNAGRMSLVNKPFRPGTLLSEVRAALRG